MSLWGRIFAAGYDLTMSGAEKAVLRGHREALLGPVKGSVLELGGGTGANLPFYGLGVDELVVTEPEEFMARKLEAKVVGHPLRVRTVRAAAEDLPFEPNSFDFVVSTLVLCTVDHPERALAESRRVLRPGGKLIFLEHVRSDGQRFARWQDRLHGLWLQLGYGCHCNRTTLESIESAGFSVTEFERDRLRKAAPIIRPLIVGVAEKSL